MGSSTGPTRTRQDDPRTLPSPAFVGVAIPARDEVERIATAVASVRVAAGHPALALTAIHVVVVDDSSSDGTAERADTALGGRGVVLRLQAGSAGAAREAGFAALCRASDGVDADRVWLATTDADSVVRPDWLVRQLAWRRRGVDGVAGLVEPYGWHEQPAIVRRRYEQHMVRHGLGHEHPHVYGANLGLSKAAYLESGGLAMLDSGEDHALWNAIRKCGRTVASVPDIVVATSARREGRAPNGFAALLRRLGEQPG